MVHYNRARTTRPDIDPEKFDSDPSQENGYKRNWLQDYAERFYPKLSPKSAAAVRNSKGLSAADSPGSRDRKNSRFPRITT
jgi:hypothetical protein